MLRFMNFKKNSTLATLAVLIMLASTLVVSVFGVSNLSGTVAVPDLKVETAVTGYTTAWTASPQYLSWIGTTDAETANCKTTYTPKTGKVTLTNTSGIPQVLSIAQVDLAGLKGGIFKIDGKEQETTIQDYSKLLNPGQSVVFEVSSPTDKEETTSIYLRAIWMAVEEVTLTFAPATNGSYKLDGTAVTANKEVKNPSTTTYNLVATPAPNYHFEGWYFGESKLSSEATWNGAAFSASGTVTARFVEDPLHSVTQKGEGLAGNISDYIDINSIYYHSLTGSYHTTTAASGAGYGPQANFPDAAWSVSGATLISGANGTAGGDRQTELGRTNAVAKINSDIIRIKVTQSCIISFKVDMSAGSMDELDQNTNGIYFYYWVTNSASANASQIMSNGVTVVDGLLQTEMNGSAEIRVNAGQYVYLYSRAHTIKSSYYMYIGPNAATDKFHYSSTISEFTISPAAENGNMQIGNYDTLGTELKDGAVLVNGTATSLSSGAVTVTSQVGTPYTLKPGAAPSGYVFIGWDVGGVRYYTQEEYSIELSSGTTTVKAIYVPAMEINAGGENGYESATYKFNGNTYITGKNPYYVARNTACTDFYYDLKTAFASTDVVVLLAGHTLNGDMVIPQGKTLVIPYGHADDGISGDTPDQVINVETVKNYCVVRYNGNLTINGTLLVNGKQTGVSTSSGRPSGGIGCFVLGDSSVVTLNGTLYAYGLLRGGQINATNTAVVHERAEFGDRRPVLLMNEIQENKGKYHLMPFNAFAIETIESSVTYYKGAQLIAHFSMLLEGTAANSYDKCTVIDDESGLFIITEGTLTKYYDFATNQTVWRVDEGADVQTGSMSITMKYEVAIDQMEITLSTKDFVFPLNQGHCLEVAGDLTISTALKFLPGSRFIVTETGHCTIASGADVILYRMNDYDYRKSGDKNNYAGYSVTGYPCWSMQYPLGGYTATKALKDLGSAKLVVDGLITVNGGLFVTNEMVSETNQGIESFIITNADGTTTEQIRLEYNQANLAKYDNGYNLISGSGIIDMTNAKSTTEKVWEVMQMSGTNAGGYYGIPVVAVKGLLKNTSVDDPEEYKSMSGDIFYGMPNEHGLTIWVTKGSENWGQGYIASNVELGNNLNFYFAFFHSGISTNSGHYIRINGGEPIYIDQWIFDDASSDNTVDYYIVVYEGLSAKQMTDRVMVTLYNAKGEAIDFWTDSIQAYSMRILKQNPDNIALKTLIMDMLNYGAACQQYFATQNGITVDEADLANAGLSDLQNYATSEVKWSTNLPDPTKDVNGSTNPYFDGANLIVTSNIQFAVRFQGLENRTVVSYYYQNHWNDGDDSERNLVKNGEIAYTKDVNVYYIDSLVVADARQVISFTVGNVTWQDSIEAYCYRMYHRKDATDAEKVVFEAFMKFSDAAEAYLEGGNRV